MDGTNLCDEYILFRKVLTEICTDTYSASVCDTRFIYGKMLRNDMHHCFLLLL